MRPGPTLTSATLSCVVLAGAATACGSSAVPRSAAEIQAEQSFLGDAVVVTPTVKPATATPTGGTRVTMVALGDAYTAGTSMGGLGAKNWSSLVAAHFGWTGVRMAAPGAGFLERGTAPGTFGEQVPAVAAKRPQIVLVWGARNDVGRSTSALGTAVTRTLLALRQQLPSAQVVVIGPSWTDATPPSTYRAADDAEKQAAAAAGVAYLDDLAENWLAGAGLVDADGVHPTDAGNAAVAAAVVRDLDTLGLPARLDPSGG